MVSYKSFIPSIFTFVLSLSQLNLAFAELQDGNQRYILTPKLETFQPDMMNYLFTEAAAKNDLQQLAYFDLNDNFLVIYETSHENLMNKRQELSKYFEIEEDSKVTINSNFNNDFQIVFRESSIPWHLNRVTKKSLSSDDSFEYVESGSCHRNNETLIDTYIVDTGIDVSHPEFEGRAVWSNNFADSINTDCNNHGTHVAGLVGSRSYGVCVDANLHAVKVLNCEGSGSLSGVIKGIEWVFNEHKRKSTSESRVVKSVINMSLGGGFSAAINRAVEMAVNHDENFYIVVAAGNENSDACNTSPASAPSVLTVMASDAYDNKAWFSNWGKCADLYSPGVDVLSTIPGGQTAKYSGTSMASPVMVGVFNHYLDMYPGKNMKGMKRLVMKKATKGLIRANRPGSKNLLAYFER